MSSSVTAGGFTSITVNFSQLPGTGAPLGAGNWDRLNFQGDANGATVS